MNLILKLSVAGDTKWEADEKGPLRLLHKKDQYWKAAACARLISVVIDSRLSSPRKPKAWSLLFCPCHYGFYLGFFDMQTKVEPTSVAASLLNNRRSRLPFSPQYAIHYWAVFKHHRLIITRLPAPAEILIRLQLDRIKSKLTGRRDSTRSLKKNLQHLERGE